MMNIRQRSVNVSRVELLEALKKNLEIHRTEYNEAVQDFHTALLDDLKAAASRVSKVAPANIERDLKNFSFRVQFPQNHEQDYMDVIEMLEMSQDALIKNEWNWQQNFRSLAMTYKASGSMLSV